MPKTRSIHIGVNEVDAQHYCNWNGHLNYCENDALFYRDLALKAGIKEQKLFVCSDIEGAQKPIAQNIDDSLKGFCSDLARGDFLFITYSGHGGQLRDINLDDENDMQDETWCLYDRQYLDDELFARFSKLPEGVRVFVISDSCHSGTMVRKTNDDKERSPENEEEAAKRAGIIFKYFGGQEPVTRNAPNKITMRTYDRNPEVYSEAVNLGIVRKENVRASVLQIGACQDDEKSVEWNGFGLLTSTIKNILDNQQFNGTYNDLYDRIKTGIVPIQAPNLCVYGMNADDFRTEELFKFSQC
jgi:hypothetical protein